MTTQSASEVGPRGALLHASVNPNRTETGVWFRYATSSTGACDDTFGTRVPETGGLPLGAGADSAEASLALTGLLPNTVYSYCAIASNLGGAAFGEVLTFRTDAEPPTVTTLPAVLAEGAPPELMGRSNPNGSVGEAWFQYGTVRPEVCSGTFGTRVPTRPIRLEPGHEEVELSQSLEGLEAGTYDFCAAVKTDAGERYGEVLSFEVEGVAGQGCGCTSASGAGAWAVLMVLAGWVGRSKRRMKSQP